MAADYLQLLIKDYEEQYRKSGIQEKYANVRILTEMVPVRDGAGLKTVVYLPESDRENFPVILTRTCYPEQDPVYRMHGENLAKRGFAYVYQYSRGRGGSEGEWEPNINERNDGIDTVKWLKKQSWCGTLGYWGYSYSSLAGWAMADKADGMITSMFLVHYGTDRFVSAYEKGEFRQDILTSWSMENAKIPIDASYPKYLESCRYRPQAEVDIKLWGQKSESYRAYITNSRGTDSYWQSGWWKTLRDIPKNTKIPVFMVSGWYDHHHGSSMKTWENLNPESRKHSRLEIGGWNHFMLPCLPDKKTEHADLEEIRKMLDWFTVTLADGKLPDPVIHVYEIGTDRWHSLPAWPAEPDHLCRLYFGKTKYSGNGYAGGLSVRFPEKEEDFHFIYDPENPSETVSGEGLLKSADKIGSLLQPEPGYREDVLSFLSEPLDEDLRICGRIKVRLYVSSSCEDTAFTAKIIEVTPEGKGYHIRSSVTTLAHELDGPYHPGSTAEVTVDMWDILYTIRKGNRIRIDLSSSDFPQYHIHSNTAGEWAFQEKVRKAEQTILTGEKFPSSVEIPVI